MLPTALGTAGNSTPGATHVESVCERWITQEALYLGVCGQKKRASVSHVRAVFSSPSSKQCSAKREHHGVQTRHSSYKRPARPRCRYPRWPASSPPWVLRTVAHAGSRARIHQRLGRVPVPSPLPQPRKPRRQGPGFQAHCPCYGSDDYLTVARKEKI